MTQQIMDEQFVLTHARISEVIERLVLLEKKVSSLESELSYTRSLAGAV